MSNSPKIESVVRDATIVNVQTRPVKNGTMTIWEVYTQDGTKWTTSRADIGNAALALVGQVADLKVSIQQNGQYTNYYVNQVQAGSGTTTPTPVTPVQQAAVQAQVAQTQPVSYADYRSGEDEKEQRRNVSIHRQTAAKVAAALHEPGESPAVFWQNVEGLVAFFATGANPWGPDNQPEPVQAAPQPQMPLYTGPEAPPHTDDDIPF